MKLKLISMLGAAALFTAVGMGASQAAPIAATGQAVQVQDPLVQQVQYHHNRHYRHHGYRHHGYRHHPRHYSRHHYRHHYRHHHRRHWH